MATAASATRKWGDRLKSSQNEIREGVTNTKKNPMELAAAKSDKWINRLNEAHQSGRFAARLRAVPIERWRANTIEVGIPRIAAGVDKAKGDMEKFFAQLLPYQENLKTEVDRMPDVTLEDSIARMTTFVRGMAEFSRS